MNGKNESHPLTVAYLTNQYPKPSHSFIRREIAELEQAGIAVRRFTIRPPVDLVDPADVAEASLTSVLLAAGPLGSAAAVARALALKPQRLGKALGKAWRLGRGAERGVLRHLVYLAESCVLDYRLRGEPIAHLHAHFGTNPAAVALLWRELSGGSYSFTAHGPAEFDRLPGISIGMKIEHARFVVAISLFGRSQLFRYCGQEHWSKIQLVHCGLDDAFFDLPLTPVPAAPKLVCIGRLCDAKGQLLLIDCAARLKTEGVRFEIVLVGDGEMRGLIEQRIRRDALHEHVKLIGWASGERVREELLSARVMVLPSFMEGLPVAIMEALALGRPVISTYVAGIPELVRDGHDGWLVFPGCADSLTDAMRAALAATPEQLTEMGKAGREQVRQNHHLPSEVARLATLLRLTGRAQDLAPPPAGASEYSSG